MRFQKTVGLTGALCLMAANALPQPSSAVEKTRFQVFASGLYSSASLAFSDARRAPLYLEELRFRGSWSGESGPAFGFGASYLVLAGVSVGAGFDIVSSSSSEVFEAQVPHPFFFNRNRRVGGESTALSYHEKVVHILASYTLVQGRFLVVVSGGPSYFWTKTEIVDGFSFSETYPYDEAVLKRVESRSYNANRLGFNVGGWVGYRLTDRLAVGGDLRYTQARVAFTTRGGSEIDFDAGGLRVGGGVRLFF